MPGPWRWAGEGAPWGAVGVFRAPRGQENAPGTLGTGGWSLGAWCAGVLVAVVVIDQSATIRAFALGHDIARQNALD